jgi:signal transduction histidine kinase
MNTSFEKIYKAGIKMLETLELKDIYKYITEEAVKLTGATDACIVLKNKREYKNVHGSSKSSKKISLSSPSTRNILADRTDVSVITGKELEKEFPEIINSPIKSLIIIPLTNLKKQYGMIIVRFKEVKSLNNEDIDSLRLFASIASSAVKKAQYYTEMTKALEVRDTFIAMAAHELRTPLTSIHGYAQLLHKKMSESDSAGSTQSKWIENLYIESTRLTKLMADLLSVNRIKSGQVQYLFDQAKISEIVNEAVSKMSNNYKNRKIQYESFLESNKDVIIGDHQKLVQVVQYLIENGINHSVEEKPIHIELRERTSHYIIAVKDKGSGISKEDLPFILEGFYKKVEGSGFGVKLFLSNSIIQQHNGIMSIDSVKNEGTTVFVKLPKVKN